LLGWPSVFGIATAMGPVIEGPASRCPQRQKMTGPHCHGFIVSQSAVYMVKRRSTWCTSANHSDVASRRHLRSAGRRLLNVPHQRRSTFAWRAFSVAGPLVWNSLPDYTWETRQSAETLSAST